MKIRINNELTIFITYFCLAFLSLFNMKKTVSFIALIICLIIQESAWAQKVVYTAEQKFNINNDFFQVLGKSGDRYYTFRSNNTGNYLDAYDNNMQAVAIVLLDFLPQKYFGIDFTIRTKDITVVYQVQNQSYTYQYAAHLDTYGKLITAPIVIDSVNTKDFYGRRNVQRFYNVYSDNKEILASYALIKKDRKVYLNLATFSPSLQKKGHASVLLQSDKEIVPQDFMLTREGVLVFSSYEYGNDVNLFNTSIDLFSVDPNENTLSKQPIDLKGYFVNGINFKIDNKTNDIRLGGFYSTKKNGNTEGFVYCKFSQNAESATEIKFIPINETIRNKADVKKRKSAMNDFDVKDVIVKNDGGMVLIAENYFETLRSGSPAVSYGGFYSLSSYGRTIREFTYGDLLVISFDAAGNIEWSEYLRKNQFSTNDEGFYSSYVLLNSGANLVFVYNENLGVNNQTISVNAINAKGDNMVERIQGNEDKNFTWVPRLGKQTGALELIVPCIKTKGLSFAKISF